MIELLSTLGEVIATLGNVRGAVVVKEHIALLQAKVSLIKEEFAKLEEENAQLRKSVAELHQQLSASAKAEEYMEGRGALFKRRAGGGYDEVVYCPRCRHSTAAFPPGFGNFVCGPCGWFSPFTEHDLPRIMIDLSKRQ